MSRVISNYQFISPLVKRDFAMYDVQQDLTKSVWLNTQLLKPGILDYPETPANSQKSLIVSPGNTRFQAFSFDLYNLFNTLWGWVRGRINAKFSKKYGAGFSLERKLARRSGDGYAAEYSRSI
jgi:hypothetical protein